MWSFFILFIFAAGAFTSDSLATRLLVGPFLLFLALASLCLPAIPRGK